MRLDSDDFELFAVPRRFEQDAARLDTRWRELQAEVHPDRYAAEGASAQRVAMQWAVRVNEAYQRLKNPVKRAAYICELAGVPIDERNKTAMPVAFLQQQMEWREALDEADSAEQVQAIANEVRARRAAALEELQLTLDQRVDIAAAADQVRALMFVERFAEDVDERLDVLEQ